MKTKRDWLCLCGHPHRDHCWDGVRAYAECRGCDCPDYRPEYHPRMRESFMGGPRAHPGAIHDAGPVQTDRELHRYEQMARSQINHV